MERDNEAIELQFGTGQPPVGHYGRARRLFKEFKVCLRKRLQSCSLSLQECVSLPASGVGVGSGVAVVMLKERFRMINGIPQVMSVRAKLFRYSQHTFTGRMRRSVSSWSPVFVTSTELNIWTALGTESISATS